MCYSRTHRYLSFAVATFLSSRPPVEVVSGTRMFRATGLPHPSPIPLRLLHSFPPAADLSISSHSLFLIIFLPLLPWLLSLSCVLHLALSSSRFINLPGPPDQLFFLPVTVQISIPETPRGRWGCGPFICVQQCLSRENRGIGLNTLGLIETYSTADYYLHFYVMDCDWIFIINRQSSSQ